MNLVEFIQSELRRLHAMLDRSIADLTPEQWHAIPGGNPKANHIAFEMWHYVRTEDNIIRFLLQDRRPTVWMDGKWADKLGLPPVTQGTGMTADDAQALRINDIAGIQEYTKEVWASTDRMAREPRRQRVRQDHHRQAARRNAEDPRSRPGLHDARLHPPRRTGANPHTARPPARHRRLTP